MREQDVVRQFTTPLIAPAFPKAWYHFHDREYLNQGVRPRVVCADLEWDGAYSPQ
jgi:acetoacetate decarboxylase